MVCLAAAPLVSLAAALAVTATGDRAGAIVGWLTVLLIIGLYVAVVLPIEYELHDDELVVRFGLVRRRVPYAEVREVLPSRSILAGPALSLDRLEIRSGSHVPLLIAPIDRDRFLLDLAAMTPHLRRDRDRLVRR